MLLPVLLCSALKPRGFVIAVVLMLGLSLSGPSFAGKPVVTFGAAGSGSVAGGKIDAVDPTFRTLLGMPGVPAGTRVLDAFGTTVQGQGVAMKLARDLDAAASKRVAAKALALGTKAIPGVGTALAVWEIWDAVHVRPDGEGGIVEGEQTDPPQQIAPCWKLGGPWGKVECAGSLAGAASPWVAGTSYSGGVKLAPQCSVNGNSGTCLLYYKMASETFNRLEGSYTGFNTPSLQAMPCPPTIDAFNPQFSSDPGRMTADGKCLSGRYNTPLSVEDAVVKADKPQFPSARLPEVVQGIIQGGTDVAPDATPGVILDPTPNPVTGTPTVTTETPAPTPANPNPAPVTTTSTPTHTINIDNRSWTVITTTVTTTSNGGTTTTTAPPSDIETCGLPGKPPCKIDETGTPEAGAYDPKKAADDALKDISDISQDPSGFWPALPTLNWAFLLPTACGAIPTPAFAPYITEIDVCPFQPIFHDLMSVIWVMLGLFGAIQMFFKNALATN